MKLPQLSLRELFLLVALVAMGCGWWVERRRAVGSDRVAKELETELTKSRERNDRLAIYSSLLQNHVHKEGYVVKERKRGEFTLEKSD